MSFFNFFNNKESNCYFSGNYFVIKTENDNISSIVNKIIFKYSDILTFEIKRFNPKSRKYSTKKYELYRFYDKRVYVWRGLAKPIIEELSNAGFTCSSFGNIKMTPPSFLYDYQNYAFNKAVEDLNKVGASTLQIATGGGKTEIAIALAMKFKKPVFFVSLSKFLIHQFVNRANKYGLDAGEVTGEVKNLKPVSGVTIQTLSKSIIDVIGDNSLKSEYNSIKYGNIKLSYDFEKELVNRFINAKLVIMDEVQHLPAMTVQNTLKYSKNSYRVGLSATPWRDDGLTNIIYAVIGMPSVNISFSQLVKFKRLVPAIITFVMYRPSYYKSTYKMRGSKGWHKVNEMLTDDAYRYCAITNLVKSIIIRKEYPLLILVRWIKQGQILSKWLEMNNINNYFIYSINTTEERDKVMDELSKNKVKVVIATTIADEGLDIPQLNSLLILSGGKSSTRTYQRVGRVVRAYKSKEGKVKKYGFVYDWIDLVSYYSNHSRQRERAYDEEPSWKIYKEYANTKLCDIYANKSAIEIIKEKYGINLSSKENKKHYDYSEYEYINI